MAMKAIFTLALMVIATGASAAETRPVVVELFTSQGCSSCPPADALLGELAKRPDVVALGYHITYWDGASWRDPLSRQESTERQRAYDGHLTGGQVYTPQMVIDGSGDFVGTDRPRITRALAQARAGVAVALSVAKPDISIDLGGQTGAAPCEVLLVAFARSAVSSIGRGENAGRTIEEFNIVRELRVLGRWDGRPQQFRARVDSLPGDATDVAVLVQRLGQAPIIGAASARLR